MQALGRSSPDCQRLISPGSQMSGRLMPTPAMPSLARWRSTIALSRQPPVTITGASSALAIRAPNCAK